MKAPWWEYREPETITCVDCQEERPECREGRCEECHNALISVANQAADEEAERVKAEQWKVITDAMKCFPSTIPEEWTK